MHALGQVVLHAFNLRTQGGRGRLIYLGSKYSSKVSFFKLCISLSCITLVDPVQDL